MSSNNELVLPGTYVDMDQAEIEYDGGMSNWGMFFAVCGIVAAAGLVLGISSLGIMAFSEGAGMVVLTAGSQGFGLGLSGLAVGGIAYGVSSAWNAIEEASQSQVRERNHHS